MKKLVIPALFISLGLLVVLFFRRPTPEILKKGTLEVFPSLSQTPSTAVYRKTQSIFVPYWSVDTLSVDEYDRVYYFGITSDGNSRIAHESGFQNLDAFVSSVPDGKQTYLVFRMTESETNSTILGNSQKWQDLIQETLNIVKEYKFDGIMLDLEMSNSLDTDMTNKINRFVELFSTQSKEENLSFSFILYGDVSYRKRPFDIAYISSLSDEIFVMAYDFHKSYGEPGPNFPLNGRALYGYDFKMMTEDLLKIIPAEKLTIIFGMYGYDWNVDEKKRPLKPARALTLNEIRENFLQSCEWEDCIVKRDEESAETEVNYVESVKSGDEYRMNFHVVWFEDEESVRQKTEYLNSKGVGSVAYWAYGYF